MPPCGNFGLLLLPSDNKAANLSKNFYKSRKEPDNLDISMSKTIHEVGRLQGVRVAGNETEWTSDRSMNGRSINGRGSVNGRIESQKKIESQAEDIGSIIRGTIKALETSLHGSLSAHGSLHNSAHGGNFLQLELPKSELLPPLEILQSQTSSTEIRGGQAGGISSMEYEVDGHAVTAEDSANKRNIVKEINPHCARVRCVARKRYPLAFDLRNLYLQEGR